MADLSDVENALVTLIAQTLYPAGIPVGVNPPSPVANVPCVVYAGWPIPAQLDADLKIGKAHVSVFPTPSERNTTRYPKKWETLSIVPATLTLAINGQQVTVGGAMPSPFSTHNLALGVGTKNYVYSVQPTDTLNSIATALAALVAVDFTGASSAGAVITLPTAAHISHARVGTTGTSIREIRRQERVFQLVTWSDTSVHRDAIVAAFDPVLAVTQFIMLADGTAARLIYKSSPITDNNQKVGLYRRDLLYTVEYATTQTEIDTQIIAVQENFSIQPTGATAPISTFTINQ
ncbi:hypothetical protein [Sideroxydans lithotrophicus]|uniref:Uncharacterized protein n=1 Tax=Sideroxydans lithotrophicus (strain ES-1) TaxID=580332 RepID=D5CT53_SIDLE|nr:hypothetical protein [Sideroxydans lithotrophicus]ADE12139.1 conserved hypothetical protein [Sideroxydans lithotrophicus ES-1]